MHTLTTHLVQVCHYKLRPVHLFTESIAVYLVSFRLEFVHHVRSVE